jgi:tyrosyl-tRNA synthetase
VEIVIGDSYAYLVNYDTSLEVVQHRTRYYACLMTAVLKSLGVPTSEIRIVIESSTVSSTAEFQRNRMRMCAVTRIDEIRAVGAEVRDTAMISPLLCPMHQALWDIHTGCDFQLGGLDQVSASPTFQPFSCTYSLWLGVNEYHRKG